MKTKLLTPILALAVSFSSFSQIPILNSRPTNTSQVIYLDFDGHVTSGTGWNSGATINALPSTLSSPNIILTWQRVTEDFIPFDVNITTDSVRFNQASTNKRMRVVITPTSAWYGSAGGVAYLTSFTWGGTPGTPCWVFENQLGYSVKNIAEACSHEAGHTLSLKHQSTYSMTPTCTKTAEYNPGQGTGVTSWAPIMGVGYYKNVTTWYTGTSSTGCNVIQYDHGGSLPGITSSGYLSFFTDDVGDVYANGKTLNLSTQALVDSGLISTPTDIDVYKFTICNNRYISIDVKPWALDTVNYSGANLDLSFKLYEATTNSLIASNASLTKLNTLVGANLSSGSYYFTIDGDGSANYSDYGSLGRYYILINTTNPPLFNNTIVTSSVICQGQATTLSYTSTGVPNNFNWQISGPTTATSTAQYPSITFTSVGVYTVTLLATNNFFSCPVTKTITVKPLPMVNVTPPLLICKDATATLSANVTGTAASVSYTWMPGNLQGNVQQVMPLVNTQYTVTGYNGSCKNTAITSVSVSPDFTLQLSASDTLFCIGDTISINAFGASNYTFNPGFIVASQISITPVSNIVYSVTGANADGCLHEDSIHFVLKDCNYVGIYKNTSDNSFKVYPNPSSDEFYVDVSEATEMKIYNYLGQLIANKQLENGKNNYNVSDFANGIYFIHFKHLNDQAVLKFLKE